MSNSDGIRPIMLAINYRQVGANELYSTRHGYFNIEEVVWDIFDCNIDLSAFSRPSKHPYWKLQALQALMIFITNFMFQTKHTNKNNLLMLMTFGPRNV
jgi:hypothetical protein